MPTPEPTPVKNPRSRRTHGWSGLLLGLTLAACQPGRDAAETTAPPPVGHYEGSLTPAGRPALRAALDIRHPAPATTRPS